MRPTDSMTISSTGGEAPRSQDRDPVGDWRAVARAHGGEPSVRVHARPSMSASNPATTRRTPSGTAGSRGGNSPDGGARPRRQEIPGHGATRADPSGRDSPGGPACPSFCMASRRSIPSRWELPRSGFQRSGLQPNLRSTPQCTRAPACARPHDAQEAVNHAPQRAGSPRGVLVRAGAKREERRVVQGARGRQRASASGAVPPLASETVSRKGTVRRTRAGRSPGWCGGAPTGRRPSVVRMRPHGNGRAELSPPLQEVAR